MFLFANTPYFDAFLKDDMKEANQNVVTIQGVTGPILQPLISFGYTGKISNVDRILTKMPSAYGFWLSSTI